MYADDYGTTQKPQPADYAMDVDDVLDYPFNWAGFLAGDTIDTSTFELPDGGTSVSESSNDTAATIFVQFTTAGTYRITNRIVTAGGRTKEKTIYIAVTDS